MAIAASADQGQLVSTMSGVSGPMAPRAAGAGTVIQGDTITISITAAPGMDEQAIARAVMLAIEQRDRQKAARRRSSLSDYDN